MTDTIGYAVLGRPIAHSLSPVLHNAGFQARGLLACRYEAVEVPTDKGWLTVVEELVERGFRGFNLTRPLKAEAACSPRVRWQDRWAEATGAVNTLSVCGGGFSGANTDAPALVESLVSRGLAPRRALVFGAGGAARASLVALEALGAEVTLAARRPGRFVGRWVDFEAGITLAPECDVVVNATPLGQVHESAWTVLPRLGPGQVGVDWVYAPPDTPFIQEALTGGASSISGLELLVRQAALAWVVWFGEAGPLAEMGRAVGWVPW